MTSDSLIKVVREGEGDPLFLAHCLYEVKVEAKDTNGTMSVFKTTAPADTLIAPPHIHPVCKEVLLVTKGKVIEFVGPAHHEIELLSGDMIYLPNNTLEGFKTTDQPAEMYWFIFPSSGSEDAFRALAKPGVNGQLPDDSYVTPSVPELDEASMIAGFQHVVGFEKK